METQGLGNAGLLGLNLLGCHVSYHLTSAPRPLVVAENGDAT